MGREMNRRGGEPNVLIFFCDQLGYVIDGPLPIG